MDVSYVLDKDTLHEKITVTNLTREPVELEDFGISLSCHTDFGWGKDASGEVLGHHFVAGHGSHSTFSRCDGTGSVFTAMPAPGSQWIFYDCPEEAGKQVQEKDTVIVYPLNARIGRQKQEMGAKLRIPYQGHTLEGRESWETACDFFFAADYEDCKKSLRPEARCRRKAFPAIRCRGICRCPSA